MKLRRTKNSIFKDLTWKHFCRSKCLLRVFALLCVLLFSALCVKNAGCTVDFGSGDPVCGNNKLEQGEVCDGEDLGGETCESLGLETGTLRCREDCSGFDASGCTGSAACGNNIAEEGELCDGTDLRGQTCESLGLEAGTLRCRADCSGFDTSDCTGSTVCGNNIAEEDELCDGTDLMGETCVTQGFYTGKLACMEDCSDFDTSGCSGWCGDGIINGNEMCDGTDLMGETCVTQGFYTGELACMEDCSGFDTSGCSGWCGDGIINGNEMCDGDNLGNMTCSDIGFDGGIIACMDDCSGFDGSGCWNLTWIHLVGGTYAMGSESGNIRERPVHDVTVPSFMMTKTQITTSRYEDCVIAGACTEPSTHTNQCNWNDPGYEEHPINCVTWFQAADFCAWVGGRLPSEAEWEYAARSGGQDITYPWGNATATCEYAAMNEGEGSGCETGRTSEVCSRPSGNTLQGLCDMAGNVWEWIQDWYHPDYEGAPDDGNAWEDPAGSQRVLRGGAIDNTAWSVRTTHRGFMAPANVAGNNGFRCVRD